MATGGGAGVATGGGVGAADGAADPAAGRDGSAVEAVALSSSGTTTQGFP